MVNFNSYNNSSSYPGDFASSILESNNTTEQLNKGCEILSLIDSTYNQATTLYQEAKQILLYEKAQDHWNKASLLWTELLNYTKEIEFIAEEIKKSATTSLNDKENSKLTEFLNNKETLFVRLLEFQLKSAESQAQVYFYSATLAPSEKTKQSLLKNASDVLKTINVSKSLEVAENNKLNNFKPLMTLLKTKQIYFEVLSAFSSFQISKTNSLLASLEKKEELWTLTKCSIEHVEKLLDPCIQAIEEEKNIFKEPQLELDSEEVLSEILEIRKRIDLKEMERLKARDIRQATFHRNKMIEFQKKALTEKSLPFKENPIEKNNETPIKIDEKDFQDASALNRFKKESPMHCLSKFEQSYFPNARLLEVTSPVPLESKPWERKSIRILELQEGDKFIRVEESWDKYDSSNRDHTLMYADQLILTFENKTDLSKFLEEMKCDIKKNEPLHLDELTHLVFLTDHTAHSIEKFQQKIKKNNLSLKEIHPCYLEKSC